MTKRKKIIIMASLLFSTFFLLFVYPCISDEHIEYNMPFTLVVFGILLFSFEELVTLIFKRNKHYYEEKR
jgi:membrane protein CcdC involved in cytochrome C biogenesis